MMEDTIAMLEVHASQIDLDPNFRNQVSLFEASWDDDKKKEIGYCITLGGDGTILWACKQFRGYYVPNIISFAFGSLGYLCMFMIEEFESIISKIMRQTPKPNLDQCNEDCIEKPLHIDFRDRLIVKVIGEKEEDSVRDIFLGADLHPSVKLNIKDFHVLNEVVVNHGPMPFCVNLDIYIDGVFLTNLVGDGIIISTPTGSTAYNLACGGSLTSTNVPVIMITPISPHSLSFRPLILPFNAKITVKASEGQGGRGKPWVGLDGATRFTLKDVEEEIEITGSSVGAPFLTNPCDNTTALWVRRLKKLLKWNNRPSQKPITKEGLENPASNSTVGANFTV